MVSGHLFIDFDETVLEWNSIYCCLSSRAPPRDDLFLPPNFDPDKITCYLYSELCYAHMIPSRKTPKNESSGSISWEPSLKKQCKAETTRYIPGDDGQIRREIGSPILAESHQDPSPLIVFPEPHYHLFRPLKHHLAGTKNLKSDVADFFKSQPPEFWAKDVGDLPNRWATVVDHCGDYIVD
ncbi:unnamed protein product [Caenorhabditis auriculariae]|uniref:Uncharacterized protein n=1 Tax=Caenorhabditis auriculariae TaxID=2777116 RepID=A0A8S1HB20_9PELO|nr:unnamed protein product [Caenorhabditis auriculariae]